MNERRRVAAIVTQYTKGSHGQHIVDRFLEGYGWRGRHHRPAIDVVSLYVDQHPEGDLSAERAARHAQMQVVPSIADALTLGGSDLAVDGVLLIAEHGSYARNDKGQHQYPRYEFFQQIVSVYRTTGKVAPIFNDKHLSWNWSWARQMYDLSRELGIPFMAGSSLPITQRTPSVEMPTDAHVEEAMCLCYGAVDNYDFHGLEAAQCMVERRAGGEAGVRWLEAYKGEQFWKAHHEQRWSPELFAACLSRSHSLVSTRPGFNHVYPTLDDMKKLVKDPVAYHYEHIDGLRTTVIMMNGLLWDFNFAARMDGGKMLSTQMLLPKAPLANFFSPQVAHIEQMLLTGKTSYPLERTLLTTGLTIAGIDSLHQSGRRMETPHLAQVAYAAPAESTFWRT